MKKYFKDKRKPVIIILVLAVLIVGVLIIFTLRNKGFKTLIGLNSFKGQIINDVAKIPDTKVITSNEGENVARGQYSVKLQPQAETEKVFISNAKLSLKSSYDLAKIEANNWASDQKLVFIKSNGALGLDGLASSWQLVFGSAQKQKTYEIIIFADKIISQKEINSNLSGFDLPLNWYDSNDAIISLRSQPQFKTDTISALSFYYSSANKSWAYGIANGDKTTSMWVK